VKLRVPGPRWPWRIVGFQAGGRLAASPRDPAGDDLREDAGRRPRRQRVYKPSRPCCRPTVRCIPASRRLAVVLQYVPAGPPNPVGGGTYDMSSPRASPPVDGRDSNTDAARPLRPTSCTRPATTTGSMSEGASSWADPEQSASWSADRCCGISSRSSRRRPRGTRRSGARDQCDARGKPYVATHRSAATLPSRLGEERLAENGINPPDRFKDDRSKTEKPPPRALLTGRPAGRSIARLSRASVRFVEIVRVASGRPVV